MQRDLKKKRAFIAGVGDDQGFGFAIAKALYEEGADVYLGVWTPIYKIFMNSWNAGKFDQARTCKNGELFSFIKAYPMDALYDKMETVPQSVRENKRYAHENHYAIKELSEEVTRDAGTIDILIHSLANAPEVKKPLLDTSREGYLSALSSSSYSLISLVQHFAPKMPKSSAILSLSYIASERAIPKYGGGMSSAKAALESDVRTLAYEIGKKWGQRINCISAGPLRSRAAKAIGMIDDMILYARNNAPLEKDLDAKEVAEAAVFLVSPLSSAITGVTLFVDNGLHAMGIAEDSASLQKTPSTIGS